MKRLTCSGSIDGVGRRFAPLPITALEKRVIEAPNGFPRKLRELRNAQHLTIGALALQVRVSAATVENWEKGHCRPRSLTLPRLAGALGVSVMSMRLLTGRALPPEQSGLATSHGAQRPVRTQTLASVINEAKRLIAVSAGTAANNITVRIEY
jgi:transcriptional regulator with XRE-family HTH domain